MKLQELRPEKFGDDIFNPHLLLPQCNLDSISVVGAGNHRQHRCSFSSLLVILHQVGSPRTTAVIGLINEGCCWWRNGSCDWRSSCWLPCTLSRWLQVCVAVILSVEADIQDGWCLSADGVGDCAGQIQLLSAKYALRSINQPDRVSSSVSGECGL